MAVDVAIYQSLAEMVAPPQSIYSLRKQTVRALATQDEAKLSSAIQPYADAVYNRRQIPRLLHEFRALAVLGEGVRGDLEGLIEFIESETAGLPARFVRFIGD